MVTLPEKKANMVWSALWSWCLRWWFCDCRRTKKVIGGSYNVLSTDIFKRSGRATKSPTTGCSNSILLLLPALLCVYSGSLGSKKETEELVLILDRRVPTWTKHSTWRRVFALLHHHLCCCCYHCRHGDIRFYGHVLGGRTKHSPWITIISQEIVPTVGRRSSTL